MKRILLIVFFSASLFISLKTDAQITCFPPTGLTTTNITTTSAKLSWNGVAGALLYVVRYRLVGHNHWKAITSNTTSMVLTGLHHDHRYEWQVQTLCILSQFSGASSTVAFTTVGIVCPDPYEPNNSEFFNATVVPPDTTIYATIYPKDDVDCYQFITAAPNTNIRITLTGLHHDYDMYIRGGPINTIIGLPMRQGLQDEVYTYKATVPHWYTVCVLGHSSGAHSNYHCYKLIIESSATPTSRISATDDDSKAILTVYPNPVAGILKATFNGSSGNTNLHYNVIDETGRIMMRNQVNAQKNTGQFEIDMSRLSPGLYILEVNNGKEKSSQKVIVK